MWSCTFFTSPLWAPTQRGSRKSPRPLLLLVYRKTADRIAAVDAERGAGHIGCLARAQEHDRIGRVAGGGGAAQRDLRQRCRDVGVGQKARRAARRKPRLDGIDADAELGELDGEALGQPVEGRLGGAI